MDGKQLAELLRSVIARQIATTASGKKLIAFDRAAVENLVTNIVGNAATVIAAELDAGDAQEAA